MSSHSDRWAILGGGFLGMTLAHRLAKEGRRVTVFEAAGHLGGLASAWSLGDFVWDRHYHVTLLSDTFLRSLLAELDLESEIKWVETRTGFYTGGELYSMSNTIEFLRFPPLGMLDKLRLGATILYASKIRNWERLEGVLATDWLRRTCGVPSFEKIWLPLLRAKLGENYDKASAAFIWAIIARMYAARRSGLKKEMFGYVPGGYARVLERFGSVLNQDGVCIKLNHRAQSVAPTRSGEIAIKFSDGQVGSFDRVVLTMAAPVAARICKGLRSDEERRLSAIQYQGIICASILLKRPLANFYVTNITDARVPFTAVIEMSALVDKATFGGNSLVYLPKYVVPDDAAFDLSDQALKRLFIDGLKRMYPQLEESDVVCFRVSREKFLFSIPTLKYSKELPDMQTFIPGLHLINSAHIVNGTLNVNETVKLAEGIARGLLSLPDRAASFAA